MRSAGRGRAPHGARPRSGTSIEIALDLVAELSGRATADEIAAAMVVHTGA